MQNSTQPLSRVLLWLPLLAIAAAALFLSIGHSQLIAGLSDPFLEELLILYIVAGCGFVAFPVAALAVVFSLADQQARRGGAALLSASWTAGTLVAATAWVAFTSTDGWYRASSTYGVQFGWQAAAAVVALVPLAAVLVARGSDRGAAHPSRV